jgi:hypothetical protein
MVVRHLRVSLPERGVRQELQRRYQPEPLLEEGMRCIAVVGAGASAPLAARGDALAEELEDRFGSIQEKQDRKAELFRLQRLYKLNPKDFETRLAALARTPEATQQVRREIARRYSYRHPTILGYELLAHLLKHRFLDAIISFNFDELLDQSLEDELGGDGHKRVVSDRDCAGVVMDPDSPDYLPLYVKLHGTASEPDSLRFTQEAYYELSHAMAEIVEALFKCQRCVIANVGFGMAGLDLHRLLGIPEKLEIYDLSPRPLSEEVQQAIRSERVDPLPDSLCEPGRRPPPKFSLLRQQLPRGNRKALCDDWMERLVGEIERLSGKQAEPKSLASLVRFRSVERHKVVAHVLGPDAALSDWTNDPKAHRGEYVKYLQQRTIVELALSGAKARGLGQLSWLALDRSGTYYDLYRREAREVYGQAERWSVLRSAAGQDENEWLPDVVESRPELCAPDAGLTMESGKWTLREFVPELLAKHVAHEIGKSRTTTEKRLARALGSLQNDSEIEIQPTDDRVCSKAFDLPLLLPTITSLDIFTSLLFNGMRPHDRIYISCETGEWLLGNQRMRALLAAQEYIEVITAFDLKYDELKKEYGDKLHLKRLNPWRHNRHMTIVCNGDNPVRAVYFARRLRAPLITPVYLAEAKDAERMKRAFDLMVEELQENKEEEALPGAQDVASAAE